MRTWVELSMFGECNKCVECKWSQTPSSFGYMHVCPMCGGGTELAIGRQLIEHKRTWLGETTRAVAFIARGEPDPIIPG